MTSIRLLLCLGMLASGCAATTTPGAPTAAQPATHEADSAEGAAKRYSDLLKAGHGLEAVETYWDLDAMFDAIFGDDMKTASDAERIQMRTLMLGFLQRIYADPKVAETMSHAKFSGFVARSTDADHAVVSFTVEFRATTVANALSMARRNGRWHIVDTATNGRSLIGLMQKEYAAKRGKVSPPLYIKAVTLGG